MPCLPTGLQTILDLSENKTSRNRGKTIIDNRILEIMHIDEYLCVSV